MQFYSFPKRYSDAEQHAKNLEMGRLAVDQCDNTTAMAQDHQRKVDALHTLADFR
jgi:hypothetical protein